MAEREGRALVHNSQLSRWAADEDIRVRFDRSFQLFGLFFFCIIFYSFNKYVSMVPEKSDSSMMRTSRMHSLVLSRHGLASLELLKVPLASAHVVSIGLEALGEGLGIGLARGTGGGGDGSVRVHGLLVLLLVLRSGLLLLGLSGGIRRSRAAEHGLNR